MSRRLALAALTSVVLAASSPAFAASAWIASAPIEPVEQRIAIAVGPSRTTTWTSLRFTGDVDAVAVIVPAPEGASVDLSSDAWFEALDDATAPRVLPPLGVAAQCKGSTAAGDPFQVVGAVAHVASTAPDASATLEDAAAVAAWAAQMGLTLDQATRAELTELAPTRFVALRFPASGGTLTETVRVAAPTTSAAVPLALVRAGSGAPLLVTTFLLGAGRGAFSPSRAARLLPSTVAWNAATQSSDYEKARSEVLLPASMALTESAGHAALSAPRAVRDGAIVDALATTYFERGAAYTNGGVDGSACAATAIAALDASLVVAKSCPGGAVTSIDAGACEESPSTDQTPPAALRCGAALDDLAIGLSGLVPSDVWLTRQSSMVQPSSAGRDVETIFAPGDEVTSLVVAGQVDVSGCAAIGGTSPGQSGSPGGGVGTGAGSKGSSNGSNWTFGDSSSEDDDEDSSGDDESGGSGEASGGDAAAVTTNDSCDGSSSGGDAAASDSCGSGGDAGGDSCGSGSSGGDDCSGGGDAGSGCSGGGSGGDDCTIGRGKPLRLRASILLMAALALAAPLRRRGTRSRRARGET